MSPDTLPDVRAPLYTLGCLDDPVDEIFDAYAAGTLPDGRAWQVTRRGTVTTATVDGLPWWSLNDTDDVAAAQDTWRLLTALAGVDEPTDEAAGCVTAATTGDPSPVDDAAAGW
jgi:hypothetical protein